MSKWAKNDMKMIADFAVCINISLKIVKINCSRLKVKKVY